MKRLPRLFHVAIATLCAACASFFPSSSDKAKLEDKGQRVTIVRDDWGIAHVYGKTDADAVFGMIYAQAEDDFNRIEVNYINAMGRMAEAEGERAVFQDLRMKLFINPDSMKALYRSSPGWLRELMVAWADGLNLYLLKHPEVHPRVLKYFEPWMALTFTEGSIGSDIESVSLEALAALYGKPAGAQGRRDPALPPETTGSNGIAIAPANTISHRALLLINPHTSFFFRSELQAVSEEGLNVYGAVTWGQFFIYQGFNDRLGWMHTSSGVDAIDEYAETLSGTGDSLFYRDGSVERPIMVEKITVPYKQDGGMGQRVFTVYRTRHGPIVRKADGKWVSVRLMQDPVRALTESYSRTKARNLTAFRETVDMRTNSSNNTVYADADGNIAYFQASFIPKRDPKFDWSRPVDGSDSATDWKGLLTLDEMPNVLNPPNGWIQNTNNWPYSAAGENSPQQNDFPKYVDTYPENPRGLHAMRLLEGRKDFSLQGLIDAAYDSYQPTFAALVPPLIKDYDALSASNPLKTKLGEQVKLLRGWDYRWSAESVPTALAVFWGEELWRRVPQREGGDEDLPGWEYVAKKATADERLGALEAASDKLAEDFGSWNTPWGEINRFQRLTDDIVHPFNDSAPSIPVPFTTAQWGSLAAIVPPAHSGTKKRYGRYGNSFVAVVEFGDSVRARAVTAGGESGDPRSKHFNDQAARYAKGDLREVYFYRSQLKGHTEREYHPGE